VEEDAEEDAWGWPRDESEAAFDLIGDRVIEAIRQLRRLSQPLQQSLYSVDGRTLTPAQVEALEVLDGQPQWRMHEVAAKLGIDQSTATRTVAPLVELGLVSRAPDPVDGRYVVVGLTRRGRRRCAAISEARRALMRDVLGEMSPARRVAFAEMLEEYVQAHTAPSVGAARRGR
jgi:DNA-binding MarR family transcriptional regulator